MSLSLDNGSGSSAQVGHGSKKVLAKAIQGAIQGVVQVPNINIHDFQTIPTNFSLLLPAALLQLQNFSRLTPPGLPSARKATNVPKLFSLLNAIFVIVDIIIQ